MVTSHHVTSISIGVSEGAPIRDVFTSTKSLDLGVYYAITSQSAVTVDSPVLSALALGHPEKSSHPDVSEHLPGVSCDLQ